MLGKGGQQIARALYRGLVRTGRLHDRHPVLKGLLNGTEDKVYDPTRGWVHFGADEGVSPADRLVQEALSEFLRGREFYHPERSLGQFVQDVRRRPWLRALDPDSQVDLAFEALRLLNRNASLASDPGSGEGAEQGGREDDPGWGGMRLGREATEGSLLIAHPRLLEPTFRYGLVLMCNAGGGGGKEGTGGGGDGEPLGVIANRPTRHTLQDMFDGGGVEPPVGWEAVSNNTVWYGGPCSSGLAGWLKVVHRCPGIKHSKPIGPAGSGLYFGGDFAEVVEAVKEGAAPPDDFRFFSGYSGWGVGQLEGEVAAGSWFVAEGAAADAAFMDGGHGESVGGHGPPSQIDSEDEEEDTDDDIMDAEMEEAVALEMSDGYARARWGRVLRALGGEYGQFSKVPPAERLMMGGY